MGNDTKTVGRDSPDNIDDPVGRTIPVGPETSKGSETDGSDTGREPAPERGRPVGTATLFASESSDSSDEAKGSDIDRPDGSDADSETGREVIPALISDKMELNPGASDGRTTDGGKEAVALSSDSSELRADTPVGRYV